MAPRPSPSRSLKRPRLGVAGIDEAGRGPLAGPVAVAAVLFDPRRIPDGIDDSKRLDQDAREALFDVIIAEALAVSIVFAPVEEIDRLNILRATLAAMRRAAATLSVAPREIVVDGRDVPPNLPCPARAVIGGDGAHLAIAAASILAKVARDRAMVALGAEFPQYGFERHKGYSTPEHLEALRRHGPCRHHRMSFAPCAQGVLPL